MIRTLLIVLSIFMVFIGAGAFAQDRVSPSNKTQVQLSFSPLVKQVAPSVVNIYTRRVVTRSYSPFGRDPFFEQFFGRSFGGLSKQQVENSLGSGVIVDSSGVVVTNAHVVKGAQEISVVLSDGREFDAKLSLSDESADLAILRMDAKGEKLPAARLASSENLEVGDIVLAIGNPFGVGQTVTSGIVSAQARSSLNINDFNFFIQTDAAINPGNSGGALVAMNGDVVGINTAIFSRSGGSLGIGFAIPSEMVQTVIAAEKAGVKSASVIRPWMGTSGQTVTADIANSLGLDRPRGVLINKIHRASPARKAGLKVGDVIVALNGREINDPAEIKFRFATVPIGEDADFTILRKGRELTFRIEAMAPPNDPVPNETVIQGNNPLNGVTVAHLNPRIGIELGVDSDRDGVVVLKGSQRNRLVRSGDMIVAINGDQIEDIDDLEKELSQAQKRGAFDIAIERKGQVRRIVIR